MITGLQMPIHKKLKLIESFWKSFWFNPQDNDELISKKILNLNDKDFTILNEVRQSKFISIKKDQRTSDSKYCTLKNLKSKKLLDCKIYRHKKVYYYVFSLPVPVQICLEDIIEKNG